MAYIFTFSGMDVDEVSEEGEGRDGVDTCLIDAFVGLIINCDLVGMGEQDRSKELPVVLKDMDGFFVVFLDVFELDQHLTNGLTVLNGDVNSLIGGDCS